MDRQRITSVKNGSLKEQDRLEIAQYLIKAGYTVRCGREKTADKSTYTYFVEFWEE